MRVLGNLLALVVVLGAASAASAQVSVTVGGYPYGGGGMVVGNPYGYGYGLQGAAPLAAVPYGPSTSFSQTNYAPGAVTTTTTTYAPVIARPVYSPVVVPYRPIAPAPFVGVGVYRPIGPVFGPAYGPFRPFPRYRW